MEIVNALVHSWPLVALILGILALVLFRKPLLQFLTRADEVGVAGVRVTAKAQEQKAVEPEPQNSLLEDLNKRLQSPLLTEVEDNIKKNLDQLSKKQDEREKSLIKILATSQIAVAFERTYFLIFGSQISALQFLNSASNVAGKPESLRPFYEQAKSKNPDFYGNYSFESWLGFLQNQCLIMQPNQQFGITVRGKEFLKYLIDQNHNLRKNG